jgi:hypothetical protein
VARAAHVSSCALARCSCHYKHGTVSTLLLHPVGLLQVIKNKIRGVNMKGFGYGGEDAYFYASGQ